MSPDGWIKMSDRWPTNADCPLQVWDAERHRNIVYDAIVDGGTWNEQRFTYWKRLKLEFPPREETQQEKDRKAFDAWSVEAPPGEGWAINAWTAALAYERQEIARILTDGPLDVESFRKASLAIRKRIGCAPWSPQQPHV